MSTQRTQRRVEVDVMVINDHTMSNDMNFWATNDGQVVDEVIIVDDPRCLPALLVEAGIFGTRKQARDAGFAEIRYGWQDVTFGKLKHRVCTFRALPCGVSWVEAAA